MIVAKQMDIRSDIKKYFDLAFEGEQIIVPRKQNKNVVIISEEQFHQMVANSRMLSYAKGLSEKQWNPASEAPAKSVIDAPLSMKEENRVRLERISNLQPGWNGNDAPSFPKALLEFVEKLIDGLPIQPEIFPTALRTIQLEYENARKDHLEIEVGEDKLASVFLATYLGTEKEETIPRTIKSIKERVLEFYG